jgi:hypothetical protein
MGSVEKIIAQFIHKPKNNMCQKKDEIEDTPLKNDIKNLGMKEIALTSIDFPSKRRGKNLIRCYLMSKNM